MEKFGDMLGRFLTKSQYSKVEFARLIKVNRITIYKYLDEAAFPSYKTLKRIAAVLNPSNKNMLEALLLKALNYSKLEVYKGRM